MSDIPKKANVNPVPDLCMGCGLCANLCAQQAIQMEWSETGFLVPRVDSSKCVGCTLCIRKCPAGKGVYGSASHVAAPDIWGAWHRDESTRKLSSSGGIFSALAEWIISQGGCVFGVVWEDASNAVFAKAETMQEMQAMRGSKYTQAQVNGVYREVKKELLRGRKVLFSGTPCQVNALSEFLGKAYDNLLTMDIVCHGVPSRKLLLKYLDEYRTGKKWVVGLNFRDKEMGWSSFGVRRFYNDGTAAFLPLYEDLYMQLFLSDSILNASCYQCPFVGAPRVSDVTLGDFWGIERYHQDWPLQSGVSVVLVHTAKAVRVFSELQDKVELYPETYENLPVGGIKLHANPKRYQPDILEKLEKEPLKKIVIEVCDIVRWGPFKVNRKWAIYRMLRAGKRFVYRLVGKQ